VTGLPRGKGGCRAYLCVSGGVDVPLVMGSRSTHVRSRIGGYKGRALQKGDIVETGDPKPLWRRSEGFVCPEELRPALFGGEPLEATDGPQADAFTDTGIETFYGNAYTVGADSDRMGYRLEGPVIEHSGSADIISDGIANGAVQVPGDGKPIVMLADRQTTGGYTKIAVLSSWSSAQMAQSLPGNSVRFRRVNENEAAAKLADFENSLRLLDEARATYRGRRYY